MTVKTVDASVTAQVPRNSIIKRFDLFHFLSLSAGLADIKVLASEVRLCRASFDYKNRGTGLAL